MLGVIATWLLKPSETIEVTRPPTADEIAAAAAQMGQPAEDADELAVAQDKVASLEREVATRERRVKELEAEMSKRAERGKEFVAQLNQLKSELASAKEQLTVAQAEKQQLLVQLMATEEELKVTTNQRDQAREDALYNRWTDFLKQAQLEICDKGNRKKLGNCRETVDAALQARQDKFAHCIRSGQEAPTVRERENNTELPAFAEMIDEEKKQTKGWMVLFCDPTLPERNDIPLAERHLPPAPG